MRILLFLALPFALFSCRDDDAPAKGAPLAQDAGKHPSAADGKTPIPRTPKDEAAAVCLIHIQDYLGKGAAAETLESEAYDAASRLLQSGGRQESRQLYQYQLKGAAMQTEVSAIRKEMKFRTDSPGGPSGQDPELGKLSDKELSAHLATAEKDLAAYLSITWEEFKARISEFQPPD
jgi:hypothetical protein